ARAVERQHQAQRRAGAAPVVEEESRRQVGRLAALLVGVAVQLDDALPLRLVELVAAAMLEADAGLAHLPALAQDLLALGLRQARDEVGEAALAARAPVELHVVA